jgi:tetratricopeptide (TPR) repeat protein
MSRCSAGDEMGSPSAAQEYIKKAADLREAGRLDEALLAARRATSVDPDEANAWWQLSLATWERDGAAAAIPHLKKTVELADAFAYGWQRLGDAYKGAAMVDKAVECWEQSVAADSERSASWRQLANAYRERERAGDDDREFEALKALERLGDVQPHMWNRLGNCYFDRKQHQKAVQCYKRYAAEDGGYVAFYNLAQSLNSPQLQQRTDAIDAWRRAELAGSQDEDAKARLKTWLPKAIELRQRVLASRRVLLSQEEWYSAYVNPYELLWLMGDGDLAGLDVKAIQKAKKKLLQEIELEDGLVEWVPGLRIDRSRAMKIADELLDDSLASYQRLVAENRELCSFLSRGDISFFLVDAQHSPVDLLERFEDETWGFSRWLSERFAVQFDVVLTKAFESRNVNAIEALLGGRRLVLPEHEDRCFEGAQRQVTRMLEPLEAAAKRAEEAKPSIASLNALLATADLGKIVSLLPQHFQHVQNDLAATIRRIAVVAHNKHGDTDLAKEIMQIGKPLAARSPAMLHQIEEDERTLDELLAEQSKNDASVQYRGESYSITRKAVVFGKQTISVEDARKLRFGIVGRREASGRCLDFNMDVVDKDERRLSLSWTAYKDIEKQESLFKGLQDAALTYLMPPILKNLEATFERGGVVKIGAAKCTKQGVHFDIDGWFSSKQLVCPWHRVAATLNNGELMISDPSERKAAHQMALATTDNALALFFLINKHQN